MMEPNNRWHVDKGIKIEVVAFFLIQLVGGVWYMSDMNTRLKTNETAMLALKETPQKLAVLDDKIDNMNTKVNDIQNKVWTLSSK